MAATHVRFRRNALPTHTAVGSEQTTTPPRVRPFAASEALPGTCPPDGSSDQWHLVLPHGVMTVRSRAASRGASLAPGSARASYGLAASRVGACWTQVRAVGLACNRAGLMGAWQCSQIPYVPSSTRSSAPSTCFRCSRAWSVMAASCARSKAIVCPSGSCSSSALESRDASMSAVMSAVMRPRLARRTACSSRRSAAASSKAVPWSGSRARDMMCRSTTPKLSPFQGHPGAENTVGGGR